MSRWALIVLVLWSFCTAPAGAQTLHGRVVSVDAGDSITLLDASGREQQIRLSAIDAPEQRQPFFAPSRDNLARWTLRRDVTVEPRGKAADGHLTGIIFVDGHDVNLEQVRAGYAWWTSIAGGNQPQDERDVYEQAGQAARYRKLGLWGDPDPIPPWEWNARHAPAGTR
jgi:endonuclease YncB( thermonuclease family)